MIVDTHAHLNTEEYVHDIDEVLVEAQIHGVYKVIVIGMDEASNRRAIELAKNMKCFLLPLEFILLC
jgi:TatD DNase family protein